MVKVAINEARSKLAELIDLVRSGERVTLEKHGKPVAVLIAVDDAELLARLEDEMDVEQARRVLAHPDPVPVDEAFKELGID